MALCVCSLAGCKAIIIHIHNAAKEATKTSEYSPMDVMMTVDKFDAYMEKVRKVRETIIADPLGSYYFSFYNNGNDYGKFAILKEHEALARSMFKEETGLLEPVYKISKQFELQPDWGKTKKIYNELSKIFKLLPMSETEEYHRLILKKMQDDRRPSRSIDYKKVEGRFYNTEYYAKVLIRFDGRPNCNLRSGCCDYFAIPFVLLHCCSKTMT